MKLKILLYSAIAIFFISSCKKDDKDNSPKLTTEQIETFAEGGKVISTQMQTFMLTSMDVALDSGYNADQAPTIPSKKSATIPAVSLSTTTYDWTGPDANGWYTRTMDGVYKYTEKVRYRDTIDYIMKIEYHGGDGSYENVTTTKYIKYTKNNKTLYKGFSRWDVSASGYNDISRFTWEIDFVDWDPATGTGIYDWYWGVSENSGGDTVPYQRFENMIVTLGKSGWLHVKSTWYDNGVETWEFEYDTPWAPVDMPEIPDINN